MTDLQTRCLDAFPEWLRGLPTDATELAKLLGDDGIPAPARQHAASALNYLFKSLDLIPDGIEDLGFLDDAFVLRVAAKLAKDKGASSPVLDRLAGDVAVLEELLTKDYARLVAYVEGLVHGAARGRTAEEIVHNPDVRGAFVTELDAWAQSYEAPSFSRDEKNLVKLTSFLSAKLPG
ncbi:MAG: DUF1232 domain-containing protein [Myxococcales bacterium]|nr:DUF1232 domain-containing protein [Myxococcales bacterium]